MRGMMAAAPPRHGIEQGDPYIVGESETDERPRQLETSRQSEMGALVRLQAVEFLAGEMHCALFVAQRTADAIYERALARAIGSDQAEAFARRNRERNIFERHKAAEALTDIFDL